MPGLTVLIILVWTLLTYSMIHIEYHCNLAIKYLDLIHTVNMTLLDQYQTINNYEDFLLHYDMIYDNHKYYRWGISAIMSKENYCIIIDTARMFDVDYKRILKRGIK